MDSSEVLAIELGPEWDSDLFARLQAVVIASGGTMKEGSWGVGGSQELGIYQIQLPGGAIEATAETYMGLVIRGPAALVRQVASAVESSPR